jgi:adenylate cyclase
MKYKVLIVDDEPSNLRALGRLLARDYTVVTAGGGAEATELILQHDFAAIISDQRMPGMTGIEFLIKAAQLRQQTVRLLLTGYTDIETLVDAINSGAVYQYLTKPWNNDDLLQTVRRALEHYESIRQSHRSRLDIARLHDRCEALRAGAFRLWDALIKTRFPELLPHARRMSDHARTVATLMSLEGSQALLIAAAARIFPALYTPHTVSEVLGATSLTGAEREKRIAELNESLDAFNDLAADEEFREIADMLRFANEHFDGSGFPERLVGDRIPLASRILAAVRAYDLLTAVGQHGRVMSHDQAIMHLTSGSMDRFDPQIIETMTRFAFVSQIPGSVCPSEPPPSRESINSSQFNIE